MQMVVEDLGTGREKEDIGRKVRERGGGEAQQLQTLQKQTPAREKVNVKWQC